MKRLLLTQRVDTVSEYEERRDALDQRWAPFLLSCGYLPSLLPNHLPTAKKIIETIPFDGAILTGGNDLSSYGGDAQERDSLEQFLIEQSIQKNFPLLGICRGMQSIQHYFEVPLEPIKGHTAQNHWIEWEGEKIQVNSFHNFGSYTSVDDLKILAKTEDGVVEAIAHTHYRMQGIMWHPERDHPFQEKDRTCFRRLFG